MNNNYKLRLYQDKNQKCLQLSFKNRIVRKWYGAFAELIFNKVLSKKQVVLLGSDCLCLNKNHIQILFSEVTCLYQMINYHLKIEKDLLKKDFPIKSWNIAEYLLFQIRINPIHMTHEELCLYFLEEYSNFDTALFDKTINLLIGKNLIQLIITDDGEQFLDKNNKPHDHIYFKEHKRLVDCSNEISNLFSPTAYSNRPIQKSGNIFTIKNEIF